MLRSNLTELKIRLVTFLWGAFYTLLAGLFTFLGSNIDLIHQVIIENIDPRLQMAVFAMFTILLQQFGKWLRNKGLLPFVEDGQKTV